MEVKVKHDKETILKGLECWSDSEKDCIKNDSCPYWKEQHSIVGCMYTILSDTRRLIDEQEAEIRQLRLALDIVKGTCKGIKSAGSQFADMPTMQSAT